MRLIRDGFTGGGSGGVNIALLATLPRPNSVQFIVALRPQKPYGILGTESPGRPPRISHSSWANLKLQALVYELLPPTTAITDYTIRLEKLSTNGHRCSNGSKFIIDK